MLWRDVEHVTSSAARAHRHNVGQISAGRAGPTTTLSPSMACHMNGA